MRKIITIIIGVSTLLFALTGVSRADELKGTISISGAWATYPTAVAWAEAFKKKYPDVKINVSAGGAGKGAADAIAGLVDIGMVSRDPDPSELNKGITAVYILHDAIYPVVSEKNVAINEILKKGITKQVLTGIYVNGTITSWDEAVGGVNKPIHIYTRSDSCGSASTLAKYLGNKKQEDLKGVGVYGDPGLLQVAIRDNAGIGYNNFSYVFTRDGSVIAGAKLIPIDVNKNGVADPDEIITNRDDAIKAIEASKYPLTRTNYFFVKGKPNGITKAFIEFALSDEGTKIVDEVGANLPLNAKDKEKVLKTLN